MQNLDKNKAIRLASPYSYTLATVLDREDRPNAIGLGWWTFTSWSPLHIAISVGQTKYSHECLEHCREFVLNFPAKDQAKGAWLCGTSSGRKGDKMRDTGFDLVPSQKVRPPTIAGATVAFEAKIYEQLETGDHTLFIAEVVSQTGSPDRPDHLYSIHYEKLVSLDAEGNLDFNIDFK
ncbi:MAG: flavin reductase family protein [Proteobacteria bacterium]|nr:flavin reductase family protein [Pseudomonadota bacterium]